MLWHGGVLASVVDLVTGSACAGCGLPGMLLCRPCEDRLQGRVRESRPTPCPEGLSPCWSAGEYDGLLRTLLLGHKEQHQFGLRRPLGALLATAVEELLRDQGLRPSDRVLLVPVPSQASTVRSRGHDATRVLAGAAARRLRQGYAVETAYLLRVARVLDQAGLDAEQRRVNLTGSMSCRQGRLSRLVGTRAWAVVVDDVLTTGATAREAQRALEAGGVGVLGVATVAATRRRFPAAGFTGNLQAGPLA